MVLIPISTAYTTNSAGGEHWIEPPIIGVDPGPRQSGYVLTRGGGVEAAGTFDNAEILSLLQQEAALSCRQVVVEWVQSYGNIVGQDVYRTAQFTGDIRNECRHLGILYSEMVRPDVCRALVGRTQKVTKAIISRAVKDWFPLTGGGSDPAVGTKKQPGPLYCMRGTEHAWDALALVMAWRQRERDKEAMKKIEEGK